MSEIKQVQKIVRAYYADVARQESACCTPPSSLYPRALLQGLPEEIAGFSAGSGDPVSPADLRPGETVLDLGSGGGLDCFLAARLVGPEGRVIGVDMTPEMLARARRDAARLGLEQVSFREGTLEALPLEDGTVDVVLSNCVINLSADKPQVYREIFRVLRPGGRLSVSDVVANHALPADCEGDQGAWCACTTGALTLSETRALLEAAGFEGIRLTPDFQPLRSAAAVASPASPGQDPHLPSVEAWENMAQTDFRSFIITAVKPKGQAAS
jgi:SAM-dependent methyltransferase